MASNRGLTPWLQDADVTECIEWSGYRGRDGYGRVQRRKRWRSPQLAHRVVWEDTFGAIPEGAQIDHLCENRGCVNPGHLALRESDKAHKQAHAEKRTHCRRGHLYDAENTRWHTDGSGRYCLTCERENARRRRAAVA